VLSRSPLIAAPSLAWHPSSHGTVTQLEFGGGLYFSELPRGTEKAFKLYIQVLLRQRPYFTYISGSKKERTLRRMRLSGTENLFF